jgi:hypothetical protein
MKDKSLKITQGVIRKTCNTMVKAKDMQYNGKAKGKNDKQ